jgi:hypothetical protein
MRSSRLVAIRTGRSKGLHWELHKSLELLSPEQVLLVVDSWTELRQMLADVEKVPPTRFSRNVWGSIGSIRAFVIFGHDWKPTLLRAKGSDWFYTDRVYDTYIPPRLARTLRPLFERLNVPWPKPHISYVQIFFAAMLFSIPVMMVYFLI